MLCRNKLKVLAMYQVSVARSTDVLEYLNTIGLVNQLYNMMQKNTCSLIMVSTSHKLATRINLVAQYCSVPFSSLD